MLKGYSLKVLLFSIVVSSTVTTFIKKYFSCSSKIPYSSHDFGINFKFPVPDMFLESRKVVKDTGARCEKYNECRNSSNTIS